MKALEFTGTMGADLKDFNFVVDLFSKDVDIRAIEGIENAERPYTIVFLKKLDHYRRKVSSDPVFSFARFTI
ncbi:hypothetical protein [Faecalispora jeddahensis]|uniref:hypothetical protein n=1 Tax=Faecalispora jeddahensis TaxID=1414721 RepID=UPI001FAC9465|nr:hypothetical protein [Faecalispora jeddahensis]